jgi:O-antigen/teichoic acid export membrane protein
VPEAFRGPFAAYAGLMIPGFFCLAMMNFALNPIFQIRRRTRPVIAAAIVGLGVNAVGLWLLPPHLGPEGVAIAQTLGLSAATLLLALRALTGADRLSLPWWDILAAGIASLAMALCLMPLRHIEPARCLALSIPLGIVVYGVLVWLFDIAGLRGHAEARLSQLTAPKAAGLE